MMILSSFACSTPVFDQAWEGKLEPQLANEYIISYCQSCHVHKEITQRQCLDEKPPLYDRPPYNTATECRICHFLTKDFWNFSGESRHTRRPEEVKENRYIEFEKNITKELKENPKTALSSPSAGRGFHSFSRSGGELSQPITSIRISSPSLISRASLRLQAAMISSFSAG